MKYRARRLPGEVDITVLAADAAGFRHHPAKLAALVVSAPQRSPDRHRRQLAACVLGRVGFTSDAAILFGEARIEDAPEFDVAGRASRPDDNRFARPHAEFSTRV